MGINITTDPHFSQPALTQAINVFPRQFGFLEELGLFGAMPKSVSSTFVKIVKTNSGLALIPVKSRQGDTNKNSQKQDQAIIIEVPHYPLDGPINAEDMQNLEMFVPNTNNGKVDPVNIFSQKINQQLMELSRKHDITHEYNRIKACNGYILDADGSTLVDLYALYGLTRANFQKNIDFGTGTTDIVGAMGNINDEMENNISDDSIGLSSNGMEFTSFAFAGKTLWNKLINSTQAKEAYQFQQGLQNQPLRQDLRKIGFIYGGTMWFKYIAKVGGTQFVADTKALLVPAGTGNTFEEYVAPANYNDTVNTLGEQKYAKIVEPNNKKGATLETQSNHLALCKRVDTCFEITDVPA